METSGCCRVAHTSRNVLFDIIPMTKVIGILVEFKTVNTSEHLKLLFKLNQNREIHTYIHVMVKMYNTK